MVHRELNLFRWSGLKQWGCSGNGRETTYVSVELLHPDRYVDGWEYRYNNLRTLGILIDSSLQY